MPAVGDVARRHVDHAAECSRPVERRSGALQDLRALDLIDGEQVPVDPAAVALVHGDAVDGHQHARVQSLHISRRAANVGLPVDHLDAGDMFERFIDRVQGTPIDILSGDVRNAGGGPFAEVRDAATDHVHGRQRERLGGKREVHHRRIAARQ